MLREVLKLIAYKYCAFVDLPGHIHKYIWNVVIKKFTIFQNYFSKKNSSSRDELDEDIFIQEFCKDWWSIALFVSCFQLIKVNITNFFEIIFQQSNASFVPLVYGRFWFISLTPFKIEFAQSWGIYNLICLVQNLWLNLYIKFLFRWSNWWPSLMTKPKFLCTYCTNFENCTGDLYFVSVIMSICRKRAPLTTGDLNCFRIHCFIFVKVEGAEDKPNGKTKLT